MIEGVHIFGIRHHGPGSARSVLAALETVQPDAVLIEGPPDAEELLPLAAHLEMCPPVALLIYRPDEPKRAVFYPFAEFSPEWQAIQWALQRGVKLRFMDLPQRHRLALEDQQKAAEASEREDIEAPVEFTPTTRRDPFAMIAEAAGFSDHERWWEEQFEKRLPGPETFKAVLELMTALREGDPTDPEDARREAWMRQTLRETQKEGCKSIALICGAWHAPALATLPTAKSDAEILKGLPKVAVSATWLPWTHRRLTYASGYGAGVHSPGYYEQLWTLGQSSELAVRWMTRVAHLMREEDLEGSTASIIEATRLAETTAALRGCAVPGLAEFNEAAQAVFCFGDHTPMALIRERLIVGDRLGAVPAEAPQVPLQRDFQKETKRLRLPPEAVDRVLELDLRKPNDLDRSRLLHRLRLLGVEWGHVTAAQGKGTFKEGWKLRWDPELELALIENAPWGNSVAEAAARLTIDRATHCTTLPELTALVEGVLLAELPETVGEVMRRIENQAALTSDAGHLMDALPPLAGALRYGSVRQTDASMLGHVVGSLISRICAGLPPACQALNDEAATDMLQRLNAVHSALATLADEAWRAEWTATLRRLSEDDRLHGLLSGRSTRLLLDDALVDADAVATHLSRHLSRANPPAQSAAWLEGFLAGSGLVLLHHPQLWALLDEWLGTLHEDHFVETLPLLRRTFATFAPPERRQMGELARQGRSAAPAPGAVDESVDLERAHQMLPTLALLLGAPAPPKS